MAKNELEWIRAQAKAGQSWKAIKAQLRMDKKNNGYEKQKTLGPMPPCLYMHYGGVRTAAYRHKIADSRKHNDATASVKLWLDSIQKEGGKSMFMDGFEGFEHLYLFAWCTEFQMRIMANNKGIVCMDSTHRTVKSLRPDPKHPKAHGTAYLFTILVKDRQSRSGIPIAFMVCNSESIMLLRKWLTWLKTDCNLQATKFMVDCSIMETETLKTGISDLGDLLLLAAGLRDMRRALNAVRYANSETELQEKWVHFQHLFPGQTSMIDYINNNWMKPEKVVRWVLYLREDYQHINTNNLVESWHATLKRQHMEHIRDMRGDDLIHLLTGVVDIDFRTHHFKVIHGLEPIALSEYDKAIKEKATVLPLAASKDMIAKLDENNEFIVNSFTTPDVKYTVSVDAQAARLLSCTCPDYVRHKMPCKHLYLVSRIYNSMDISYDGSDMFLRDEDVTDDDMNNGSEVDDDDSSEDEIPAAWRVIVPLVVLQMELARAEKKAERRKLRESERAIEFNG
ncbi:MAG: hypothetical protein J3R72DRAFT_497555, partial [Linnemannia gamsii]